MNFSILDSEESKNIAVVHKTNQGYSGKDLWKLKQERPELFGVAAAQNGKPAPPGFEQLREMPGWMYHRDKALYFQRESGLLYCRDPATNELYELHQGEDYGSTLTVRGDAAAVAAKGQASRNVIINDLHRAAASMKLDFSHHDSPAAMFAVYDAASNSEHTEAAAKGLHMQLLPRLAAFRGRWQNDRLQGALSEAIEHLRQELGETGGIPLAVALLLGGRLTMAATGGAVCMIFGQVGQSDGNVDNLEVVGADSEATTHCAVLEDSHLGALLTVQGVRSSGLSANRMRALARAHTMADRPRAGCVSLLEEAQKAGGAPPLVAAAVRFSWSKGSQPKKPKTDTTKVRCRHLLLRHVGCQAPLGDRRKKPTRSAGEAELEMLRILPQIAHGGAGAFTAKCKEVSECDTAMKSGDLAGDLGWLDKDVAKNRKVPAPVVRAAFLLAVGQVSDLVSSERGIHLILRTA
ncbi:unnamed protein product [Effrenium voratum]|uniref:peptidylprolyl isomerase n=1 Tax=Effrenium voratum TaxID=2562239 RepID=A0AA36HPG1_9DINO|nr:unnamed protein product [Effrenium voratum]CAJ1439180.1 unnamed protein product [Effrenium voratum]